MTHEIITPSFVREDERGTLREVLNSGAWMSIVQGEMRPGAVMGNHYHKETQVFFYLLSGAADIVTEHVIKKTRERFSLSTQQGVLLNTYESHIITFSQASSYLLLKSLPYDPDHDDTYHHPLS